jgi:hypothetical protein
MQNMQNLITTPLTSASLTSASLTSASLTSAPLTSDSLKKKKAMSKEKASFVKKEGHTNEDDFAALVGGVKVEGTGKTDVRMPTEDGVIWKNCSLKKICKRIQFALYSAESKHWSSSEITALCKACFAVYPPTFAEYQSNKTEVKARLRGPMVALKEFLNADPDHVTAFLRQFITNGDEIDLLVMKAEGYDVKAECNEGYDVKAEGYDVKAEGDEGAEKTPIHYIFDAKEVIQILVSNTRVSNSTGFKAGETPEQKVIFKYEKKPGTWKNIIEVEMRNSSEQHYAELLCVCNRDDLLGLLLKGTESKGTTKGTDSEGTIYYRGIV